MSAPSDKHAPPHAGAAAAASGSHHDKPPEKEESSFARWKKKFTSKTKKAEISATPAALTMMNVAATYRAASQRAAMRVLRLWKQNVEAAKAKEAADQARAKLAAQPTAGMSGLGLGLAGAFGSPINRPRQSTTPKAAGSTASPKAPRSPQLPQFSFEDKTVTEMNEAEQSEEISKGVPIPRSSGHPVTNAISSTHAFSSSPALPSVLTSTSVPDGADVFAPAGSPTLAGSKTMMLPHRRIASSTESIDSISGELATPASACRPMVPGPP
jgi:hypothetical protein